MGWVAGRTGNGGGSLYPPSLSGPNLARRGLTLCIGDGRSLLCPVCVSPEHLFLLMPLLEKKDILENRIGTSV